MISVLIVGDSSFVRLVLKKHLLSHKELKVVGDTPCGPDAVRAIKEYNPQIVLVDIDIPSSKSLYQIQFIMSQMPTCTMIVMMNLMIGGAEIALKAMELGAVDFIHKESSILDLDVHAFENALLAKIMHWGSVTTKKPPGQKELMTHISKNFHTMQSNAVLPITSHYAKKPSRPIDIVLMGISTGGPLTLLNVLSKISHINCPFIIAQHMPPVFTKSLSIHLRHETHLNIVEGSHGLLLEPGMIVIARGGIDSYVYVGPNNQLILKEKMNEESSIHPCVDELFLSAARCPIEILGIVMTGMGADGLEGAYALHTKHMPIVAQDPHSCIVSGMPLAVIEAGLATHVLNADKIGELIAQWCS